MWITILGLGIAVVTKPMEAAPPPALEGIASWYGRSSPGVRRYTASGEVFDDTKKICASWNFSFGTRLKVTNLENGKSVICRVNDRGPHKRLNRLIDLSRSAFREIADLEQGLVPVMITNTASSSDKRYRG